MGSVKILEAVIRNIDSPRIRMCFDSEHAYANGMDLNNSKRLMQIADIIEVVHFNSIPSNVIQGGHLDRHSETLLEECKEGISYIMNVYNYLYDGNRPFILERSSNEFFYKDCIFLSKYDMPFYVDIDSDSYVIVGDENE